MGRMDDEQAAFEQITLRYFKNWSSTALRTSNNSTIIITNNNDKNKNIISAVFLLCCLFFSLFNRLIWWISYSFQTFRRSRKSPFEHLERKNCIYLACLPCVLFFSLKLYKAFRIAQCKQSRLVKLWLNFDTNLIFKSTVTRGSSFLLTPLLVSHRKTRKPFPQHL